MWYLFIQIWVWVLVAFILGWFAHWFFCCRNKDDSVDGSINASAKTEEALGNESAQTATGVAGAVAASAGGPDAGLAISDDWKPQGFASRPEQVDDLKRVKGIGAVIEETLNNLGIYQFAQISAWNQDNVSWVESFLAFPGRVGREGWVDQARTLSGGGTTEFASRVDKGEVDYD